MHRIAIVGMGGFGSNLARQVDAHPDATLAAVVDVAEENLVAAAEHHGLPDEALFTDDAAMYDAADPDAVLVATPPAFHLEQVERALENDCHVLCEKPVVMDTDEAVALRDLERSTDRVVMTGYQRHLNPGFVHARERWRDGGPEPTFVTGELTQDWRDVFESGENWRTDPEVGGYGHLFSVGTHVVESVLWLTGLTPASVSAEMTFHDDAGRIDEQASLAVRFENGATATLADTATAPATREHIHVWDDAGAVYLEGENWGRRHLTVYDGDNEDVTPAVDYERTPSKVAAFLDAVESGSEPASTVQDAVRVTALLEAAYEAANEGRRVDVDLP